MSGIDIQDFKTVTIGSRANRPVSASKQAKAGDKKQSGVVGISSKLDGGAAAKLDDNELKAPEPIGSEVGKAIAKARNEKGWTQKDLADKLNIQRAIILQLEQGTHKKDNQLLQKVENKLGVYVTGDLERLGTPKVRGNKAKAASSSPAAGAKGGSKGAQKKSVEQSEMAVLSQAGTVEDADSETVTAKVNNSDADAGRQKDAESTS